MSSVRFKTCPSKNNDCISQLLNYIYMHEYLIGYLQASESDDWKHEIAAQDI